MTTYNVLFGSTSDGITLGRGDFLNVSSGGVADGIMVGNRANLTVSSGGATSGTEVTSKGTETVQSGGQASGSVVGMGGEQEIDAGGTAIETVISGGNVRVSGGIADFTLLSAGNEYVYSGGSANGTVVSAMGKLFVLSAGNASGATLTGGYEYAFSAGVVSATLVESGGVVQVASSGTALDSIVSSGGQETVLSGGTAKGETISGGGFDIVFGQTSGAMVNGGQNLYPGAIASGTVVGSGGIQLVSAGGVANGTIVDDGGQQEILAGGVADETVLNAGGRIDLPDLGFSVGGTVVLDPVSDVLTVTEGSASYQERLSGIYAAGSFEALQDSGSGTLITIAAADPPPVGGLDPPPVDGSDPPAPRTLEWTGGPDASFGDAADWIDISDSPIPAAIAPEATDTAEFLTGGGVITGTGAASVLQFGGNTSWNVTSAASLSAETEVMVGQSVAGGLLINDGASVNGLGRSDDISGDPGEGASVTVDGAGSAWRSAGELVVGDSGIGDLTISNAAVLNAAASGTLPAMALGTEGGGTGSLLVTGAGSSATLRGQLDVGQAGDGTLTVADQGTVQTGNDPALDAAEGVDIAQLAGGAGNATVTGVGSLLNNTGAFIVGDAGLGSLSIQSGAAVTTTPGSAPDGLVIANTASASGSSVNVSGAGSNLQVGGTLVVGAAGSGALSLSQGASVAAAALDVAAGATGDGDVSIAGTGTTLDITGSLTLGDQAAGELSILGGAQMTIGGGVVGGTGAAAAGNLDVEGQGSQFTINGGTLVVGANGPAEFTLGVGATLSGEVATELFGVTNEYGNVDPATDPNDGTQNVGFGNSSVYDFFVANSGTIHITAGTATFYTPLVTFETNASSGSINGLWQIGSKDTLVMNATSVDSSQTFDLTSPNAATLVIGQVPQSDPNTLDTFNGMTTPTLTGSIAAGSRNVLAGWDAPIENYVSGDVIVLRGLTYGSATASGDVVTVWSGGGGTGNVLGSLTFIDTGDSTTSLAALADAAAAAVQINAMACFAAGTRIETSDGLVAVEDLSPGGEVRTVHSSTVGRAAHGWMVPEDGRCDPIVWVGSRTVDCGAHPKPEAVWPVRVRAGAFGENVPVRDLYLSPDHAVFVNDVLVPVKLLVNGTSIEQVKRNHVVYYHVELPEHAVILAEGLTVESYLDTGDRANFDDQGTIRLFPDFSVRARCSSVIWETHGCAQLVTTGPELAAVRHLLQDRARVLHQRDCHRRRNVRERK